MYRIYNTKILSTQSQWR